MLVIRYRLKWLIGSIGEADIGSCKKGKTDREGESRKGRGKHTGSRV